MEKEKLIKTICELILDDKSDEARKLSNNHYPFERNPLFKRKYTKTQMCKIYLRDGFIDRYSGKKLLFPGIIRILSLEFPDIFKYHKNWKISETHMIYWDLMPTLDHIKPIARGGNDEEDNYVTTSMKRNSAKANWTLEELHWQLQPTGDLDDWDGLTSYFLKLVELKPEYENDNYMKSWKLALLKARD